MAVKSVLSFNGGFHHLGKKDFGGYGQVSASSSSLSWRLKPIDDGNSSSSISSSSSASSSSSLEVMKKMGNGGGNEELKKWNRDLASLPEPLSASNFSDNSSNVHVAYQGSPGAFSECAALKAYPECETLPCNQFEIAFKAVELWIADKAVIPIENSFSGSIHRNYDLFLCHSLHIIGEVQLSVNYCLMALPGVKKEEIKRVLSHPFALAQCEIELSNLGVIRESAVNTVAAAKFVSLSGLRDCGAVASVRAASLYGLDILEEKFQDYPESVTRFLILARDPIIPRTDRPFKTSIVFALEEGPGVLFKSLSVFAFRNINLSKIESRPQRKRPLRVVDDSKHGKAKYFDYLFYIDFEASMAQPRAQYALARLQEYTTFLRVLGSYPMDMTLQVPCP